VLPKLHVQNNTQTYTAKPILHSYEVLSDRYQAKQDSETSNYYQAQSRVRQGSILGPLLYLFYTADIPTTQYTTIATFAIDTVLLSIHENRVLASDKI
jgi:hypothetical protein